VSNYSESDVRTKLVEQTSTITVDAHVVLERFQHGLVRRRQRGMVAAVVATFVVIGVPVLVVTTAGRGPARSASQVSLTSYASVCRLEPDACLPRTAGNVPRALSRPLKLPSLSSNGTCPVTSGHQSNSSYVSGLAFGTGPVQMVFGDHGTPTQGRIVLGHPDVSSWLAAENVLLINPRYRGPVSVRGQRIDGPGIAYLDGSDVATYIDPPYPDANTQPDGARTPPVSIFVRNPGCYAFQIDGLGFTQTIVIDLVQPPTGMR
jgi:hypothetical protein